MDVTFVVNQVSSEITTTAISDISVDEAGLPHLKMVQ
jgi:hypothetical protein